MTMEIPKSSSQLLLLILSREIESPLSFEIC